MGDTGPVPGEDDITAIVAEASRPLRLVLENDPAASDVLADLDGRPPLPEPLEEASLARWKALEWLRITARDLTGIDDLPTTAAAVADLATDVLAAARRLAGADDLLVVGMGKLGGRELNYASDVDVMFVGPDDADGLARDVLRITRTCFRADANLRPEGRNGRLVRSLPAFEAYWQRWAAPWEFQALLKARPVSGPDELAASFEASASEHLWGRSMSADDLRSLRSMKARAEAEVARRGLADRELKRGTGGIRDVEFSVQLLQLVHGRADPALRTPTTLDALAELARAGYVDEDDAAELAASYRFLRRVEHLVQLAEGLQEHAVPADDEARRRLARLQGFRPTPAVDALDAFDAELGRHRARVRAIHERLYFRPLLEAFADAPGALGAEAVEARLTAFGFADAERTRQAVRELTRGLTRSSRLMSQLLPLLLGWLSDSPDPDRGLLGLRTLASGPQRSSELARAFRESTETARRLCTLLGTSRHLSEILERNPDLVPDLGDARRLQPRDRATLLERARARTYGLRRLHDRETLRIATRDIVENAGVDATAHDLTTLAEASVEAALEAAAPAVPMTLVAMGRFGGGELSYASDLDLLVVYDGTTEAEIAEAERAGTAFLRLLGGATPADRVFAVDLGLRPEGRQGSVSRSLGGYRAYLDRWAAVWERQALVRARPVAGDDDLGRRFMELVEHWVWDRPVTAEDVREIRRIKARVERERIPAGEDPQFHLKLGRGSLSDVEFTAQLLQLQHGVRATGTMQALARLNQADVLSQDDTEVLAEAYRFCERTRSRLQLVEGGSGDALPQTADAFRRLARSLDVTPVELRERYRRVTRRSRAVVERLFYGNR
jgi:[glutamine synthetase] adenylyltransferase / [glutamine synthetase]-adenylyl-L-tyrosine phosphorylase